MGLDLFDRELEKELPLGMNQGRRRIGEKRSRPVIEHPALLSNKAVRAYIGLRAMENAAVCDA